MTVKRAQVERMGHRVYVLVLELSTPLAAYIKPCPLFCVF